jgi:hypothetical protein
LNLIKRTYRLRGREVQVDELADLRAIRKGGHSRRLTSNPDRDVPPEAESQLRAFEQAGWAVVPRSQVNEGFKFYIKRGGRVALATDRLTVGLVSDRSQDDAEQLLGQQGFHVVDRLKMGPNLFVVQVPHGYDTLEAANQLSSVNDVEFAEPEMIELISGR